MTVRDSASEITAGDGTVSRWFNCGMTTTGGSITGALALDGRADGVLSALRGVYDPCCEEKQISIVDMGLIQSIDADTEDVKVELILTSGWCPFAVDLVGLVRGAAESVEGVRHADVELTWDEAWGPHRLSDEARVKLRFLPDPKRVVDRDAYVAANLPSPTTHHGARTP
jgi:metal-sulfur cluster biosynthetic enzyme